MLPILTFDERTLSTSFGYWFDPNWIDPQESIVSILWKYARSNGLGGQMIAAQFAKTSVDPYEGIPPTRAAVNMRLLHQTLGIQLKLVRTALIPESLRKISSPYLRFCPKCLRRGYHSVVHQLEPIHLCPIHGLWLQTECASCGRASPYHLNASLLDAPFRCSHCHAYYGTGQPCFLSRTPLSKRSRRILTRTKLSYYGS